MRRSLPIWCAAMLGISTTPAFAYLDPGTGSMILQGIIASIAAAAASISVFWGRLRAYFTRRSGTRRGDDRVTETDGEQP